LIIKTKPLQWYDSQADLIWPDGPRSPDPNRLLLAAELAFYFSRKEM
jgi:hypothetical protein